MPSFSERNGYVIKPLQVETISVELRNRIWNTYTCEIHIVTHFDVNSNYLEEIMDACGLTFTQIRNPIDLEKNLNVFRKWFFHAEWYRIFDFIEIYLNYLSAAERKDARKNFNAILAAENSGYRIIETQVVPVTNQDEISCVEKAQKSKFHSVNTHIKKAIDLFSLRPTPDYENSIKESISAVEALCCIITGKSGGNATLGKTIMKLKDSGVHIHLAMEKAFSSLYGYTCDENGIRHGGIDFTNAPAEDAKYMLVSCSAFINYLIEKWSNVSPK